MENHGKIMEFDSRKRLGTLKTAKINLKKAEFYTVCLWMEWI